MQIPYADLSLMIAMRLFASMSLSRSDSASQEKFHHSRVNLSYIKLNPMTISLFSSHSHRVWHNAREFAVFVNQFVFEETISVFEATRLFILADIP
jgi:hypothetical protein